MTKNIFHKNFIYIATLSFVLLSCKKTDTNPTTQKLKKVHIDNNGVDFTDVEFTYNSNGLVSSRKDSISALGAYPGGYYFFEMWNSFFSYNSGDDKPLSDSTVHTTPGTSYTTVSKYYYDAQNRLIKTESYVSGNLIYTKLINYSNGQRIEDFAYNSTNGSLYYHDSIFINSLNQAYSIITNVSGSTNFVDKDLFTFDNNKNPYYELNTIKYGARGTDSSYSFDHTLSLFDQTTGPNNILTDSSYLKDFSSGQYVLSRTFLTTYNYNNNGYPTSARRERTYYPSGIPTYEGIIGISYEYY